MDASLTILQLLLLIAAGGIAALSLAGFFGAASGWLDFAAHLRPHLAVASLPGVVAALLLFGSPASLLLAAAFGLTAVVNIGVILVEHRYRTVRLTDAAAAGGTTLTIASLNVRFGNRQHERAARWIRSECPDVLVVTEVDRTWAPTIEGLADLYPCRAIGRTKYVTMLSRRPWTSFEIAAGPRPTQGLLVARFDIDGTTLTVIGAHPASPVNRYRMKARDAELQVIGQLAAAAPGPVAAMGDFNATPWCAPMRRLVRTSPLRYADLRATTWPTLLPRWLGIKIDHIVLGKGCTLLDYKVGPDVGSDHRPVVATIRCPPVRRA